MKYSVQWLSEFTGELPLSPKELSAAITQKVAESEGVEPSGAHFGSVRVVRVKSAEPIEGSKNQKATIDAGPLGTHTVVCGAPNCRAGLLTTWVPPGTTIPAGEIGTRTVSGIVSAGMLASAAELGINSDNSGILELAAGTPGDLTEFAPDSLIDVDNKTLTNRPDLWGHFGMAREVSAITGLPLRDPADLSLLPAGEPAFPITIADHALCPRYSGVIIENVTVGPSPLWLQRRLEALGMNPISNVVDITNYVAAELAQPMHAFDLDKLASAEILVRLAQPGESLKALNQETYELDTQTLVIADRSGPVAIAGVIGGLDTGVSTSTTRILFESANFQAISVRKTSTRLKIRTDASMRFEKSQDPHNTTRGLARAIALLRELSPGMRIVGGLADNCAPLPPRPVIQLPIPWLRAKLGEPVQARGAAAMLAPLGFECRETSPDLLEVTVPTWRATKDISIKEDLAEEVGRMIGYGNIQAAPPPVPTIPPARNAERDYFHRLRDQATAQGFTEVYNYSFLSDAQAVEIGLDPASLLRVANPIASDQNLMRPTLLAGVVRNVRDNSRHFDACRFFEIGSEIHPRPADLPDEIPHLAACVWSREGDGAAGLFEAKRLAECLLPGAKVEATEPRPTEHPVRAWTVRWQSMPVGRLFELHPNLVPGRAAVLDIDLRATQALGDPPIRYQPLRRFPSSDFDLSILAPLREPVAELKRKLEAAAGPDVLSVEFVRQYTGDKLPEGFKSASYRVTVGAQDRTLTNDEITKIRAGLIASVEKAGYQLRV